MADEFSQLELLTYEIRNLLRNSRDTLFVTVGNSFRSDDGVGEYIAKKLQERDFRQIVNAGSTPENIIDEVIERKPTTIIFLDAADFRGSPGQTRIIPEETLDQCTVSTHSIPLTVISRLIADSISTTIHFIGIQATTFQFGEGLSPDVQSTADEIVSIIMG